jgi:2-dehydropantoate 2-reductase
MTRGVREGFAAVRALGHTVAPFPLWVLFSWLPQAFAIYYWRRFFAAEIAEQVFGRHTRAAPGEMRAVAGDCRTMLEKSGVEASALPQLYRAIDARAA